MESTDSFYYMYTLSCFNISNSYQQRSSDYKAEIF